MLAVSRDLPQWPSIGHCVSEAPRPLDDPARGGGHLHRSLLPRPRRHHKNCFLLVITCQSGAHRHLDLQVPGPRLRDPLVAAVYVVVGPSLLSTSFLDALTSGQLALVILGRSAQHMVRDRLRPGQAESLSRDIRLPRGLSHALVVRARGTCAGRGGVQPGGRLICLEGILVHDAVDDEVDMRPRQLVTRVRNNFDCRTRQFRPARSGRDAPVERRPVAAVTKTVRRDCDTPELLVREDY